MWCDLGGSHVDISLTDGRQRLRTHLKYTTHVRLFTFNEHTQ